MSRSKDISSAYDAMDITKSDATVIPVTRGIYIGGAGNLVARMASGRQQTFNNVPVGVFTIQIDMVLNATTCTDMVALY